MMWWTTRPPVAMPLAFTAIGLLGYTGIAGIDWTPSCSKGAMDDQVVAGGRVAMRIQ